MAMVNQAQSRPTRAPKTPISRRKSIADKLDMDLAKEDLRKDDEERLEELIENLASWLTQLLGIPVTPDNFLDTLRNGTVLCSVANKINGAAQRYRKEHPDTDIKLPTKSVGKYHTRCQPLSFHARENVSKFVRWAGDFGVGDALLFNSEDLIVGDGKKVALCLQAIVKKTKLFMPTLDFEISKMVAVLRDLGTLLGSNFGTNLQTDNNHKDKIMDNLIIERGFWRGIQQRISDALKSESSIKRDVNHQDMQMLKLLGISQISRSKMENTIEESRREEMLKVLQAAAKNDHRNSCRNMVSDNENDRSVSENGESVEDETSSDQSNLETEEEATIVQVLSRPKYQFVSVKVSGTPSKMPSSEVLLTPEMFFYGANRPKYEDLSLDMFMQGYTAMLSDERVTEVERSGRLKLLQLIFTNIVKKGWVAMRETHKKITELIHSGDLGWSDELDTTFNMLIEEHMISRSCSEDNSVSRTSSTKRAGCSSCGGRTPLRGRRTTPLTVTRHVVRKNSENRSMTATGS
ncbi:uncharacterized protein LOC134820333 isoform X2 [Bolinopsis microptera]|uniref:uncharacterized protein LOC134820333 isoform X2 n=1 Tax=Bolinopsis microptera TaxID=2820187 RepID=UPI00307A9BBE